MSKTNDFRANGEHGGDSLIPRPGLPTGAFVLGKENPEMIAVAESFSRIADAMELIAQGLGRLGPKEEVKEKAAPQMLTPEKAAKILRLNVQTVMKWCREKDPKKKKFHAAKIGGNEFNGRGGKWLIPTEEIDAYLRRDRLIKGPRKEDGK